MFKKAAIKCYVRDEAHPSSYEKVVAVKDPKDAVTLKMNPLIANARAIAVELRGPVELLNRSHQRVSIKLFRKDGKQVDLGAVCLDKPAEADLTPKSQQKHLRDCRFDPDSDVLSVSVQLLTDEPMSLGATPAPVPPSGDQSTVILASNLPIQPTVSSKVDTSTNDAIMAQLRATDDKNEKAKLLGIRWDLKPDLEVWAKEPAVPWGQQIILEVPNALKWTKELADHFAPSTMARMALEANTEFATRGGNYRGNDRDRGRGQDRNYDRNRGGYDRERPRYEEERPRERDRPRGPGGYQGGQSGGYQGGHPGGYQGGHQGSHPNEYQGGHSGGYQSGHQGGFQGGYQGGYQGGHQGGNPGGYQGGNPGGYQGGHPRGYQGDYQGGHQGGHPGGYPSGHQGGNPSRNSRDGGSAQGGGWYQDDRRSGGRTYR